MKFHAVCVIIVYLCRIVRRLQICQIISAVIYFCEIFSKKEQQYYFENNQDIKIPRNRIILTMHKDLHNL